MSTDLAGRLERLRRTGIGTLPGHAEFMRMAGYERPPAEAVADDPAVRASAVLIPLYAVGAVPHTLLMLRPTYNGVHSAQVSFPGGKHEPGDPDLAHTARREFTEETGAPTDGMQLIGPLTPVYIPPSRTVVTPWLAHAHELGPFTPDPTEVAELIPVPLDELMRHDTLTTSRVYIHNLDQYWKVPAFRLQGHVVWGATALMIAELRAILGRA
ncbi:MAG: CoA pyrophosphatase [Flavobacteriales bacterium]|jgi:8-oxo-dGTP pyrophosphatase MutT (NUDIX family)|nr:CoA pyrophosphatase [Flavobacteriales bacterium]